VALGRSVYQLGIRAVEHAHYWRLFFWTLFRRPRLFPMAITLAIMGFHFRQVTELHVGRRLKQEACKLAVNSS
jgi:hypothetical protein